MQIAVRLQVRARQIGCEKPDHSFQGVICRPAYHARSHRTSWLYRVLRQSFERIALSSKNHAMQTVLAMFAVDIQVCIISRLGTRYPGGYNAYDFNVLWYSDFDVFLR